MLRMTLTIPGEAISANAVYQMGRGRIYLAPWAKQYRRDAAPYVKAAWDRHGPRYEGGALELSLKVHSVYFSPDGDVLIKDADNAIKNIQDSIFPVIGLNDALVFKISAEKIHSYAKPKVQVILRELPRKDFGGPFGAPVRAAAGRSPGQSPPRHAGRRAGR